MNSTTPTPASVPSGRFVFTLPITLLIAVGTGGVWPAHMELGTGGAFNQFNLREIARSNRGERRSETAFTAADDIDHIKNSLKLTTTELAKYLGVSRQAVYDWRAGGHVKSHNITKLENLRAAANVIAESGATFSALQISRKLPGGRTLLETIAAGGDGYEAAQSLVTMLSREMSQRQDRIARLAGRKPVTDSEFAPGMAALRESG